MTTIADNKPEIASIHFTSKIYSDANEAASGKLFQKHVSEMTEVVEKVLSAKKLCKDLAELDEHLPVVHWESHATGEISLYLLATPLAGYNLFQFLLDMIMQWLSPEAQATIATARHLTFRFFDYPKNTYCICEVVAFVEDAKTFSFIQKNISSFAELITLGSRSVSHAQALLVSKVLMQEPSTAQLYKAIAEIANRKYRSTGPEIFFEMQHLLLACDEEFKRIRHTRHLCRIICCHYSFRQQLQKLRAHERHILLKVLETTLQFQFGKKPIVALVISLSELKEYERFEARHILSAIQRFIPDSSIVPHSFFAYKTATNTIHSFYVEIEKKDGSSITKTELRALKQGLIQELFLSIEPLSHKLFMPHNEEEVLRDILLLKQQVRYVRDIPQMIISFHGQTDTSVIFHVILVRVIQNENTPTIEQLFEKARTGIRFISGTKKIVGQIRNKYPKEATIFHVECLKYDFLRQDHSIDLGRAREYVSTAVEALLGEVRDFNGGLIFQQNKLLSSVKHLLGTYEKKYELHLENLFYSIQPTLMRSTLPQEILRQFFELFLSLKKEKTGDSKSPRYKELFKEKMLCIIACSKDTALFKATATIWKEAFLTEGEVATMAIVINGISYFGYIVISHDENKITRFRELFKSVFAARGTLLLPKNLRISLPQHNAFLDPRISTDRSSAIIIKMLYDGLMRVNPSGKLCCSAAESVHVSEDQKTYTFTIRHAQWTNGQRVTAYDFEYSWKKMLDPDFTTLFAYLFYDIKNAKKVKTGLLPIDAVGIVVKNPHTLEVHLENPAPYFLELTSHWIYSPLCKDIDRLYPGWAYYGNHTYVCNGPFRLEKLKRNTEIHVIKNTRYWDASSVHLQQINISIIESAEEAFKLYHRGELDWIGEPLCEIPPHIFHEKKYRDTLHSHPIAAIHWYVCNTQLPPFSSQKCRRALAIALNRQTLINETLGGVEQPAYTIIPQGLSTHQEAYFPDDDHILACKLFEEGLQEQNMSLKQLPPFIITCLDHELYKSCAIATARQWQKILGIEVHVAFYKWDRFLEKYSQQDFQIVGTTWYSWFSDPLYNLRCLNGCFDTMSTTKWENSQFDACISKAEICTDPFKRSEWMHKAEVIAMREMPVIPLFHYIFKYMKRDYVHNVFLSNLGQMDFKWATIGG